MKNKKKEFIDMLNRILEKAEKSLIKVKGLVKTTQDKMPYVYEEIEKVIKSHIITLEKDQGLLHNPNMDSFTDIITKNLANKLPNLDQNQVNQIITDKSSTSFLDMVTRGRTNPEDEKDYTKISKKKIFNNVLIANRGEIALRIIRACKELDIKTTIIYSTQDKDALAVKFADKAYNIGSKAKDYLNYEKIIKIAKKSKSDAIHPGYGFLAENSKFTRLCEKNKIKFIGPSPKSMELMGNKDTARKTTQKLGIPLLIGTDALKDEGHALNSAEDIGYPVIIKAVAGGGGKGMRIVRKRKDIESAFKSAQSEAESAFGNKEVYMEKYLDDPSHIEFQILADKSGNAIHLGERECSIQRRHQKLIEEAPSPLLNSELREKIGEAAIKIVKEVKYEGAGTVEFLLDKNKNFYFMEMNTRIQVEHGITEMVTGVDLIKEQIKIAAGAKLAYKQKDIRIDGSAIECRINAECPAEDFCPKTGTIINYLPPGGPGIRVCSSCHAGHVVSPHYDSLISKLMCKGSTRQEAISRMQRALEEFIIEGVDTTIPFHKAVLDSKAFLKGKLTTNFIEKYHILDKLKSEKPKKNGLTKKEKILIVTTAVAKHLDNNSNNKQSAWASAAKYESANNFEENV